MMFLPSAAALWLFPEFGHATSSSGNPRKSLKGEVNPISKPGIERALKNPNADSYPTCTNATDPSHVIRLWTMDEVNKNMSHCNTVFFNRVYLMDDFIPIHKGGAAAIERNCRKDATWLFQNLQCISMVPDHFEGMLSMCAGFVVGVIKGSEEDPCADTTNGIFHPDWEEPIYEDPDFTDCDVYHNITCDALQEVESPLLDLPNKTVQALGNTSLAVTDRRWKTPDDVVDAQKVWPVDEENNSTEHCYTILHGYVYDFAISPLDGSPPFYKKHGNGLFPWEILKHCGNDMTIPFDAIDGRDELCVPDHTLGGMNVLSGYLVGVEMEGEKDRCSEAGNPPTPCDYHEDQGLKWYADENEVSALVSADSCYVILQGGVYNLTEFATYHAGGPNQITTRCGTDATKTFMSKTFHQHRIFLASLQDFQTGFIANSTSDPCSDNYDETLAWW